MNEDKASSDKDINITVHVQDIHTELVKRADSSTIVKEIEAELEKRSSSASLVQKSEEIDTLLAKGDKVKTESSDPSESDTAKTCKQQEYQKIQTKKLATFLSLVKSEEFIESEEIQTDEAEAMLHLKRVSIDLLGIEQFEGDPTLLQLAGILKSLHLRILGRMFDLKSFYRLIS